MLNVALFGMTAKEWKDNNPELEGNMRNYANILQLVILSNLENLNAEMIERGLEPVSYTHLTLPTICSV